MQDRKINDDWDGHYRGYKLRADDKWQVWWVPYRGDEKLYAIRVPRSILDGIKLVKPEGGSVRVIETTGDVIGKVANNGSWTAKWIGRLKRPLKFATKGEPDLELAMRPTGLKPGDLWPSIYDGAKYSFLGRDRLWWTNPEGFRQYAKECFPESTLRELLYYKTAGGSVRITPWGDILTLVPTHPAPPQELIRQFDKLPRIVRNIVAIRRDRGLSMIPIYVGTVDFEVTLMPPRRLTDPLSPEKRKEMHDFLASFQPKGFAGMAPKGTEDRVEFENGLEPDDPEDWIPEDERNR